MSKCTKCGKESKIILNNLNLCEKCFNKFMAEKMGMDVIENTPRVLLFEDCNKVMHSFKIEFMVFPMGLSLKAIEVEPDEYECSILGELDEKFLVLWDKLLVKLKKMMTIKYNVNDRWVKNLAVGRLEYNENSDFSDIIIDGKRIGWEELGSFLKRYESFQIKIEIADVTDDLF